MPCACCCRLASQKSGMVFYPADGWGAERFAFASGVGSAWYNSNSVGVNSISFGPLNVCPRWALSTCSEPNEPKKDTHPQNVAAHFFCVQTGNTWFKAVAWKSFAGTKPDYDQKITMEVGSWLGPCRRKAARWLHAAYASCHPQVSIEQGFSPRICCTG